MTDAICQTVYAVILQDLNEITATTSILLDLLLDYGKGEKWKCT
jgi:hypothetical protein